MSSNRSILYLTAIFVVMASVFVLDLFTPLGVAIWALYVFPIVAVYLQSSPIRVTQTTAIATVLIHLGFWISPPGIDSGLALLNRIFGTLLIWFTTSVLIHQRRLNESLRHERDVSDAVLNSLPGIYIMCDEQSRILRWNSQLESLTGLSTTSIFQRPAAELFGDHSRTLLAEVIRSVFETGHTEAEFELNSASGDRFTFQFTGVRVEINRRLCLLGIGTDITRRKTAESNANRLAAIVDSTNEAIISIDRNSMVTSWNHGAENLFGYPASEIEGTSILNLIIPESQNQQLPFLNEIGVGQDVDHCHIQFRRKNGSLIDVSVTASPIVNQAGEIIGISKIARDITLQKQYERELSRITALYAALSQVNQAIVWTSTREELFTKVCQVLIKFGGLRMAWIGWHNSDTHQIVPVAQQGDSGGFLTHLKVYSDERPEGQGPSGIAFRSGRPYVCNDIRQDPVTLRWRSELLRCGFLAVAVFPIRFNNMVSGILHVCTDQADFFYDKEISLLEEAATDISFALDNFDRNEARSRAERLLLGEKHFSDTMIESMPGILYFYDSAGQFLRWNRNFEVVSGYSAEEIRRMHPLQFFEGADKAQVEQRIAEVFTKGESSIEADFVSKDGTRTPFFFTGRHVKFDGELCLVGVGINISDRRRAENLLGESERKYRELVENANSIIIRWNSDGLIKFLNEFGQRFFGYSSEEILGQHVMGTIVPEQESGGRDLRKLIAKICEFPEAFEQSINENIRRNGERVWIAWTNRIVRNSHGTVVEFLSIGTDITARKIAETKVRESEARYHTLFDYAPDGIVITNSDNIYLDVNPSLCRMLGYQRHELIGLNASEIVALSEVQADNPSVAVPLETIDHYREWVLRRKDGSLFPAEVLATWMPDGNRLGMIRDISERKEAEAEREKRQQAEAADRIKSAFLATMSHELRTPLNSIIGFTGIILQGLAGPLNEEQSKQLGMVRTSARHLLALVNDVLDISKIEAGQLEVSFERFDLNRSIAKVVSVIAPLADKKSIPLKVQISSDLREWVGDARRFEQILLNLLSNAIKFTDAGEVTLSADSVEEFLFPKTTSPVSAIRVIVADTGIGIEDSDLDQLFQPFRQIDSGLSRNHDGTGLGLAICHRLTELMGGTIKVTSCRHQGSTFTVFLPVKVSFQS